MVAARIISSSVSIFSRTRLFTRVISAMSLTGLVRKSSAPASSPATRSRGLVERGDHDHRDVGGARIGLQPPADLEAVHARHHHVEQDDVALAARADLERLRPVDRGHHLEILGRQPRFEQLDVGDDVVDDENAGGHLADRSVSRRRDRL